MKLASLFSFAVLISLVTLSSSASAGDPEELTFRLRDFMQETYGSHEDPPAHYTHFLPRLSVSVGYGNLVPVGRRGQEDGVVQMEISGMLANDTQRELAIVPFEIRLLIDRDIDERLDAHQLELIRIGAFRALINESYSTELVTFIHRNSLSNPYLQWRGIRFLTFNISHSLWRSRSGRAELVLRGEFSAGYTDERRANYFIPVADPDAAVVWYQEERMGTAEASLGAEVRIKDAINLYGQVRAAVQFDLRPEFTPEPAQVLDWVVGARFDITSLDDRLRLSLEPQYREEILYMPEPGTPRGGSRTRTALPSLNFILEW